MDELLVFGSEDCMSWEDTRTTLDQLKNDPDFDPTISVLDPGEHSEQFRELGLVICPSVVYRNELITVGPPTREEIKDAVRSIDEEDTSCNV